MPKRRNPFDDTHFLLKMHIGIKEVNLGVNYVENMKKVYDHTYKMLFNGSENFQKKLTRLQNGTHIFQNGSTGGNNHHSLPPINGNKLPSITEDQAKKPLMNPCCMTYQQIICSFCEKTACISCSRTCHVCHSEFCQLCSVLQYDSQEETALCLSCL